MSKFVDAKIEILGIAGDGSKFRNSRNLILAMLDYGYSWHPNGNIGSKDIPSDEILSKIEWIVCKSDGTMFRSSNPTLCAHINYRWWDSFLFETALLDHNNKNLKLVPRFVDGKVATFGHNHTETLIKKLFDIGYRWSPKNSYTKEPDEMPTNLTSIEWIFLNKNGTMSCTTFQIVPNYSLKTYRFIKLPIYVSAYPENHPKLRNNYIVT